MFKRFIGYNCDATILFGDTYTMTTAVVPLHVRGVLESCDENYICIKTKKGYSVIPIKTLLNLEVTN